MLFHREDCYKIEWTAEYDVYLMMSIEHYRIASFDTEYLTFFEAVDLQHKTNLMFSHQQIDDSKGLGLIGKSVTITETREGLQRLLSQLFRDQLGVDDTIKIGEMVEDTINHLTEDSVY